MTEAATALVFDARPAAAGASAFEEAAQRVIQANRAAARLEKAQASVTRATLTFSERQRSAW